MQPCAGTEIARQDRGADAVGNGNRLRRRVLVRRLTGRGTESAAEQARRLETARVELAAQDEFDVKVVNRDVGRAAQEVVELLAVPGTSSARTNT